MKHFLHIFIICVMFFAASSCEDYLTVMTPSQIDEDFVFSSPDESLKVLMGCYTWLNDNTHIHSNRTFYDILVVGSDSECHPEAYIGQDRHRPEGLSVEELPIDNSIYTGMWDAMYTLVNRLAIIRDQIGSKQGYKDAKSAGIANDWSQLYGEAVTMRAFVYYELCRIYGDVPYFHNAIYTQDQIDGAVLTPRFELYDQLLASIQEVEPNMYRLGEGGITAERVNRTFAQALIGRIALHAGGYSTCRTDMDYGVDFEQIGNVKWNAKYVRPGNYRSYYELARTYLEACINNPGSAYLVTTDERGAGFNNPFQRHFQYMMDLKISPESLFEFGNVQGLGTAVERPYAFGRPSNGGNGGSFPNNSYGQSRMYPVFYYGEYDNADLRRDVTITISANTGACSERLISLRKGNRLLGGPCNNKWDESRMTNPYMYAQRTSGINAPYMRMADAILLLAEVYAELGNEGSAKAELTKVRARAFSAADQAVKVTGYVNGLSGEALKEAIAQERKYEFAGEGLRRYDLIRSGKFPQKIKELRDAQRAMVEGLKANGYYTFANGNQISEYIWTKYVDAADYGMNYMLTTQCIVSESDLSFPLCFPGWRGNHDGWPDLDHNSGNRSLAIQGLFRYIDPNGPEAAALEADGFEKTDWGVDLVSEENENVDNVFRGYTDALYAEGAPPRYPYPINSITIKQSNGLITNGYGYAQE